MRVRGHTGSFFLDAIAGIDIALWDICGKAYRQPLCRLFGGSPDFQIPTYISGLEGNDLHSRLSYAQSQAAAGATRFKIFLDTTQDDCLRLIDHLREECSEEIEIYVDALWRLKPKSALAFARQLESRRVGWLEAPLKPEDVRGHGKLAANSPHTGSTVSVPCDGGGLGIEINEQALQEFVAP